MQNDLSYRHYFRGQKSKLFAIKDLIQFSVEHSISLKIKAAFLLTNLKPDSAIENYRRFPVPFMDKPILDCNLNNPPPNVDRSDW